MSNYAQQKDKETLIHMAAEQAWGWNLKPYEEVQETYTRQGLTLFGPHDIQQLDATRLGELSEQNTELLGRVYGSTPPLAAKEKHLWGEQVRKGEILPFMLFNEQGKLCAASALVKTHDELPTYEMGRAVALHARFPDTGIGARPMILAQTSWLREGSGSDLGAKLLVANMRTAGKSPYNPPSEGVQGVAFGAWNDGQVPFMPTFVSLAGYVLGEGKRKESQPYLDLAALIDLNQGLKAASKQPLFIHDEVAAAQLHTLLYEGTKHNLNPQIQVVSDTASREVGFREVAAGNSSSGGVYEATLDGPLAYDDLQTALREMPSQRIVIPEELAQTALAAAITRYHCERGWGLAGWVPSSRRLGGMGIALARVRHLRFHRRLSTVVV